MQKYGRQDNGAERLTDCQDACLCRRQVVETFQVKAKCNDGAEQYHAEYGAERIERYFAGTANGLLKQEMNSPPNSILQPMTFVGEYFARILRGWSV